MEAKKVLIVEDDFMLSLINKKYVEMLGHKVVASVTCGSEAIKAAQEFSPDVILMDIRLDGTLDGIDAMKEIEKFSEAPVIYLSGNSDPEHKQRAAQTNMLAFCVKPVLFEQLQQFFSKL